MFFTVVKKKKKSRPGLHFSLAVFPLVRGNVYDPPRVLFIGTTLGTRADFGFARSINIIRSDTPNFHGPPPRYNVRPKLSYV